MNNIATLDDFLDRIELLGDDFMWYNYKQSPTTKIQIDEYEKSHGFRFNSDIKQFLQTYGAVILEVDEKIWKRPREYDVIPAWEFGYGMFIYGLSSNEDMLSWLTYGEKFLETMTSGDISLGQLFFKRSGNLYRAYINNDAVITVEYNDMGDDRNIFEGNFYDFLISEVNKLEADYEEYMKKYHHKNK